MKCKYFLSFVVFITGVERGKIGINLVGNNDFQCKRVSFSNSFSDGSPVRLFVSINHGNESHVVHDPAFIWVEEVTTNDFKACLVKGGRGIESNSTTIDWFAFQGSQLGVHHGEASFSIFTTATKCKQVAFAQVNWFIYQLRIVSGLGQSPHKEEGLGWGGGGGNQVVFRGNGVASIFTIRNHLKFI